MKRFLTLAALTIVLFGCTEKQPEGGGDVPGDETCTVSATIEEGGMMEWLGGDKLSIFTPDHINHKFLYRGQGAFSLLGDEEATWEKGAEIRAVYPYSESNTVSGEGAIRLDIPEIQTYRRNTVAQHMNPMVAVSRSNNLGFRNVCGYLKVKVIGSITLTSVRLKGNNGEKIAGEAFVRASEYADPSVAMSDGAGTAITVDCGKGIWAGNSGFESAVFHFVLPPTSFTKGVTVEMVSSSGEVFKFRTIDPVNVGRGCVTALETIEFGYITEVEPIRFRSEGQSTIALKRIGNPGEVFLDYSLGGEWMPYTVGEEISLSDGEEVSFHASVETNLTFSRSATDYYRFEGTGSLEASGSIMTLLDPDLKIGEIPEEYCFYGLFSGMQALTRAPSLTSRTVKPHCYDRMFSGCSRLSYIKALFLASPEDGSFTSGWVEGVSPEGVFSMSPDADWSHTGTSGVPQGWTVRNMPEDDDVNYYESIEYLIPHTSHGANSMKAEQKNDRDPSEWVFTTTGRDPFIPLKSLERQADGPVLVFQYKASEKAGCEFFWCSGGYGVHGPAGGIETPFTLEATKEWKTFTMNMQEAWKKFGFEGKPGDTVRFDIGNKAGIVVTVRLMRWRKVTEED